MADPRDPMNPDEELNQHEHYAEEAPEIEEDDAPRRAASARFIVDTELSSEVVLRDAMDPANQSLAEALRLSYRVLQIVMLLLVVLFLASGFRTVDDGQSGVATVWGRIRTVDGEAALSPGPQFSLYPYPIGDFILFDVDRVVDLGNTFAPGNPAGLSEEKLREAASVRSSLFPGQDGSLITREGDLAHMKFRVRYEIRYPDQFVQQVNDSDRNRNADALVKMAVQRAAVQIVAQMSVEELIDVTHTDDTRMRIRELAQATLDDLQCGIVLQSIDDYRAYAPLAIQKIDTELQATLVAAQEQIERAEQRAAEALNRVAGPQHVVLTRLIEQYERALELGEESEAQTILASINEELDNVSGEVARVVQQARAYRSQIESTLGTEWQIFQSYLAAFRENPKHFVKQRWLEAYADVLSRPDVEIMFVPGSLASIRLSLAGSAAIQELRRKASFARRQQETNRSILTNDPYIFRGEDMTLRGPGRQLKIDSEGQLRPFGVR